eukprot:g2520.t1
MTWRNKTYCYFMYVCGSTTPGCNGVNETHYGHGLVATSDDGVHFEDTSAFNAEYQGVGWFKCMIHKVKDVDGKPMFVMDHGTSGAVTGPDSPNAKLPNDRGCPAGTSQCLRFLKSSDAVTWEYMYTLHPDSRWYKADKGGVSKGRWDHAYIQEDEKRGGYIAFPVATPAAPRPPAPGILRSSDGLNWTVEEPVVTDWSPKDPKSGVPVPITPAGFEIGGVERMPNGRYYMIGGGGPYGFGYSMFTLVSESTDVAGPYAPDPGAYRLSGQSKTMMSKSFNQALAAWARNYDTYPAAGSALISQYMVMPKTADIPAGQKSLAGGGHVWLLPFRKPVLDADGHMRLQHWEGNERMKGERIAGVAPTLTVTVTDPPDAPGPNPNANPNANTSEGRANAIGAGGRIKGTDISAAFIAGSEEWNHIQGVVVSGTLHIPPASTLSTTSAGAGASASATRSSTSSSSSSSSGSSVYSVGVAVQTTTTSVGCGGKQPCDAGPDIGYDRGGNDEHCFSVNDTYTAADCAAACEADPVCQAWTLISKPKTTPKPGPQPQPKQRRQHGRRQGTALGAATDVGAASGSSGMLPCQKGKPLTVPYCTLKAPFPSELIRPVPQATTGVATRALSNLRNRTSQATTAMLMDIVTAGSGSGSGSGSGGESGNSTRVWQAPGDAGEPKTLRDVSGPFGCGPNGKLCLPATTVTVKAGAELPFLLYARHGTLELYAGSPPMLVQTTVYGKYPQARGAVGFAVGGGSSGAQLEISGIEAWALNLAVH